MISNDKMLLSRNWGILVSVEEKREIYICLTVLNTMFQEVNLILIWREKERGFVEQCCQWHKLYSMNCS